MERRRFLSLSGLALVAACVPSAKKKNRGMEPPFTGHLFPALPFAYNALQPWIDARTMELHYDKHYRGYYNKFMAAIRGTDLETTVMVDIFREVSRLSPEIRNNGGGYYNHRFFWENLSHEGGKPSARLLNALVKDFKSFNGFKEAFNQVATNHFGSGWSWLIYDKETKVLRVYSSSNQDNPLMDLSSQRGIPIMVLDVWEHAYYLNYQNRRADYVAGFWDMLNWKVVSKRFERALRGQWHG